MGAQRSDPDGGGQSGRAAGGRGVHDLIGDVHGHAEELVALLGRLGYRQSRGAWRHPSRLAVFVGDFLDRGPRILETLRLVRAMLEAGSALAVLGKDRTRSGRMGWLELVS